MEGGGDPPLEITFDYLQEIALGQLRISREQFWEMTPREFQNAMTGFFELTKYHDQQEWERTRWNTWVLLNIQLDKRKKIKLHELLPFPWEKKRTVKLPTPEEIEAIKKLYGRGSNTEGKNMG